jgi:hypothetical protein
MPKKSRDTGSLLLTAVSNVKQNGIPGSAASPAAPTATPTVTQTGGFFMDPLSVGIMWINTNPYIIGMLMLLLNLGGRFLTLELTKKQEAFLQAAWVRQLIFFTVIFIATRNIVVAFWVTLLFFFIIWVVANENSPYCMIPSWCGDAKESEDAKDIYESNIQTLKAFFPSIDVSTNL